LSGVSRFVEEKYRGEIQTPIWNKLKLYQWLAVIFLLLGIVISMIPSSSQFIDLQWKNTYLLYSFVFGLIAAFAMGMDFPYSKKRFSRLAN
jgi:drug/metabolite transporter (DMT)-like permease